MVKIEFIDGTEEVIEFTPQSFEPPYDYDSTCEAFKVRIDGVYARFPREFVKSIRYIEV